MQYNLVGKHKDDTDSLVIGTYPNQEEAQTAAEEATEHDPNNNWKFYAEPVKDEGST